MQIEVPFLCDAVTVQVLPQVPARYAAIHAPEGRFLVYYFNGRMNLIALHPIDASLGADLTQLSKEALIEITSNGFSAGPYLKKWLRAGYELLHWRGAASDSEGYTYIRTQLASHSVIPYYRVWNAERISECFIMREALQWHNREIVGDPMTRELDSMDYTFIRAYGELSMRLICGGASDELLQVLETAHRLHDEDPFGAGRAVMACAGTRGMALYEELHRVLDSTSTKELIRMCTPL